MFWPRGAPTGSEIGLNSLFRPAEEEAKSHANLKAEY
jgi:hypothetical protein